jgi:hypothetical protein
MTHKELLSLRAEENFFWVPDGLEELDFDWDGIDALDGSSLIIIAFLTSSDHSPFFSKHFDQLLVDDDEFSSQCLPVCT